MLQFCFHSDGVWDPEKWHASLYPCSGRTSPVESFKKDLDLDRTSLMRRIVGKWILIAQDSKLNTSCWKTFPLGKKSLKIVSLHKISVKEISVALTIVCGILATVRTNLGSSQLSYYSCYIIVNTSVIMEVQGTISLQFKTEYLGL